MPRILMAKGGKPGDPGLYQRLITDKNGRQVTHWMRVEARRAAYNPNQLSLDFDRDPYPALETRPGTRPEQRAAGNAALEALRRRLNRLRDRGGPAATLLGARLHRDFVAQGGAQLVGQRVGSPGDLAALAQVYRDPRFETFRCFYVRDGEVVGESAYSSRLPGAVQLPDDIAPQITADMGRFGADGYYLLHNHPSGIAMPSKPDVYLTQHIATNAPGLISHVIIDHKEYATLDGSGFGSIKVVQEPALTGPDFHNAPSMDHPLLGGKLERPQDVAIVAKALQIDGALKASPVLIMTKGMHAEVDLIASAPRAVLNQAGGKTHRAQAWLRGVARASGAGSNRFLIVSDADFEAYRAAGAPLIRDHVVHDVVSASGRSMREHAYPEAPRDILDTRRAGRRVAEPGGANEFVRAPDGSIDFGEITPEMAQSMRRQTGKIRLQRGDDSYGERHIELRHGKQIRRLGFSNAAEFVADAMQHIGSIWLPSKSAQLVVIQSEERGKAVFIALSPSENGDFYTVNTAFPIGDGYAEKKSGWKLLWGGASVPAIASGANPLAELPPSAGAAAAMTPGQSSNLIIFPLRQLRKALPRVARIQARP
jgi:hypothetical protein